MALLRGINVGGKNKLPMKDLAAMFGDAGCWDVQTYIQSGNVVFRAKQALARRIPSLIAQSIEEGFGFSVPVVLRPGDELLTVAGSNPFLRGEADTKKLHVAFLDKEPSNAKIASLDPERSSPDQFETRGREIYLYCPNGLARTKLTNNYFDSRLATTSTMRNWKTVLKLCDLVAESERNGSR
ncbi:MAG: DUF1697 domain-containing protein [Myxococcota bacterium]